MIWIVLAVVVILLLVAPVRVTNAQNASAHAVDENVTLSALAGGVRFYKYFLRDYDSDTNTHNRFGCGYFAIRACRIRWKVV